MDMVTPKFSPSDIERFAEVTPATLRGWRHRGLLKGFGEEQANGRWLYSGTEVLTMAIGQHLMSAAVDLKFGLWIGWTVAIDVVRTISGRDHDLGKPAVLMGFWTIHAGDPEIRTQGWELQWKALDEIKALEAIKASSCTVINVPSLAEAIPAEFQDYIRGGDSD